MMNIVVVLGSPRKESQGNSLAMEVARGAESNSHNVTIYRVNEMNIRGCQGCRACKDNNIDCVLNDDLKQYWSKLHDAGALIISSPNYAGGVCGPMITFMNRHYCLIDAGWKPRVHPGIKLVGIFSQGREDLDGYLSEYKKYLADFENREMQLVDIIVNSARLPREYDKLTARAYEIGKSL
jgi:multimeric flavodoxin WrbA